MLVQLCVEVFPLSIPAGHPHPGEDVGGTGFGSFFHNGGDILLSILDERQDGHHGDAGLDAVIRQHAHGFQPRGRAGGIGFHFGCQVVIRRGDGEADGGVDLVDALDGLQVLEHQVAFGDNVDGEAELRDHFQRATHQVDLSLQGHIGVVHRAQTDDALDPLAGEFLAQQLDGVVLDQHLAVEILNLVALRTAIAIYAPVHAPSIKVHVVFQPEIRVGLFGVT